MRCRWRETFKHQVHGRRMRLLEAKGPINRTFRAAVSCYRHPSGRPPHVASPTAVRLHTAYQSALPSLNTQPELEPTSAAGFQPDRAGAGSPLLPAPPAHGRTDFESTTRLRAAASSREAGRRIAFGRSRSSQSTRLRRENERVADLNAVHKITDPGSVPLQAEADPGYTLSICSLLH